jgi:hypothetical protein
MELALNLGWVVVATLMFWLWMRHAVPNGADRRTQLAALALAIVILFPVISMTDDIAMAQNPAETTDCCQRKDHLSATAHSTLHPVAATIQPVFAEPYSGSSALAVLGNLLAPAVKILALDSIRNRPPPAA